MNDLEEEVLAGYPEETFVTYRNCRIFYKYKEHFGGWFCIIYLTGHEAAQPGYPTLGCEWLVSKEQAIAWGKQVVDSYRNG